VSARSKADSALSENFKTHFYWTHEMKVNMLSKHLWSSCPWICKDSVPQKFFLSPSPN